MEYIFISIYFVISIEKADHTLVIYILLFYIAVIFFPNLGKCILKNFYHIFTTVKNNRPIYVLNIEKQGN